MTKIFNKDTDFATHKLDIENRYNSNLIYFKNYIIGVSRELTDYEEKIVENYYCEKFDDYYRVEIKVMTLEELNKMVNITTYFIYDESKNEYIIEI